MKHAWLMIIAEDCITHSSSFYKIWVGDTKKENVQLTTLKMVANARNHYLHLYDAEATTFMQRIADSLSLKVYDIVKLDISIITLMKYFYQTKCFPPMPSQDLRDPRLLQYLKPSSYFDAQIRVLRKAEAGTRIKPKSIHTENMG